MLSGWLKSIENIRSFVSGVFGFKLKQIVAFSPVVRSLQSTLLFQLICELTPMIVWLFAPVGPVAVAVAPPANEKSRPRSLRSNAPKVVAPNHVSPAVWDAVSAFW